MTFTCRAHCAECCGVIHVSAPFWKRHGDKACRPLEEVIASGSWIFPLTKDGKCAFLRQDLSCAVYHVRPSICKRYGEDPLLPCPYLDHKGRPRSKEDSQAMQEVINQTVEDHMRQIGLAQ